MKTKIQTTLTLLSLMTFLACQEKASFTETTKENTIEKKQSQLTWKATTTETGHCYVVDVESEITFVDEDRVGLNVYMSDDVLLHEIAESTYEPEIDTSNFSVKLKDTDEFEEYEFLTPVHPDAQDVINLMIYGFSQPTEETEYTIHLAENSITCADGSTNSSAYDIDLTVIVGEISYSCAPGSCPTAPVEEE